MAVTPLEFLGTLRADGYPKDHTKRPKEMVINRTMTKLEAAAAIHFILGSNGHALSFLCDDNATQLKGDHIFSHARRFIQENRPETETAEVRLDGGDIIKVNGELYEVIEDVWDNSFYLRPTDEGL